MQSAGGGALGTGRCGVFSDSLRQLDPAELLMLLLDADRPEPVRSGAHELALFLTPEPGAEVGDTVGSGEDGSRGRGMLGPRVSGESGRMGIPSALDPDPRLLATSFCTRRWGCRLALAAREAPLGRRGGCLASPRDARQVAPAPFSSPHGPGAQTLFPPDRSALGAAALCQPGPRGRARGAGGRLTPPPPAPTPVLPLPGRSACSVLSCLPDARRRRAGCGCVGEHPASVRFCR